MQGTTTEKAVADFLRQQSMPATVVLVKDHDEGLAGLQTSKMEAYASDRTILVGLVLQARGTARYALIAEDLSYEPYGFMVRRDDSAFRFVANRALARIYRSGAIGAIYAKWFGAARQADARARPDVRAPGSAGVGTARRRPARPADNLVRAGRSRRIAPGASSTGITDAKVGTRVRRGPEARWTPRTCSSSCASTVSARAPRVALPAGSS